MCSYVATEYITQHFSPERSFEAWDVYASLIAISVSGIGSFVLWRAKEWGAVKSTLACLSIFVLGLIATSTLAPEYHELRYWSLRLGYIGSLAALTILGWRTHQIRFPQLACSFIIACNLMALLSLVPWSTKPLTRERCGAVLTTQSLQTNFASYAEVVRLWPAPRPQLQNSCAVGFRVASGETFHGPFEIVRADGTVSSGEFRYGTTNDELLACRYKRNEDGPTFPPGWEPKRRRPAVESQ